jgi:hypothetical protein
MLLAIIAVAESSTGVVLFLAPSMVIRLLFGVEVAGVGVVVSRIAGISLIGLGIACWPGRPAAPVMGIFAYNLLGALYLGYVGLRGESVGPLLWPVALVHVGLAGVLGRVVAQQLGSKPDR